MSIMSFSAGMAHAESWPPYIWQEIYALSYIAAANETSQCKDPSIMICVQSCSPPHIGFLPPCHPHLAVKGTNPRPRLAPQHRIPHRAACWFWSRRLAWHWLTQIISNPPAYQGSESWAPVLHEWLEPIKRPVYAAGNDSDEACLPAVLGWRDARDMNSFRGGYEVGAKTAYLDKQQMIRWDSCVATFQHFSPTASL